MKIKFTNTWDGPYGVFTKGRTCELSGVMLAAAPKDAYVAVLPEGAKDGEAKTTAGTQSGSEGKRDKS